MTAGPHSAASDAGRSQPVPLELSLLAAMVANAKWHPDRTAVVCGAQRVSWRSFDERTNQLGGALLSAGLRKGDAVALLCGNCIAFLEVMFGTLKAGGVIVPLSNQITGPSLASMIRDADARFVFADAHGRTLLEGHIDQFAPQLRIGLDFHDAAWTDFQSFVAAATLSPLAVSIRGSDPFSIMYTSGTTGTPKGMVHDHRARAQFAALFALNLRMGPTTVALACTALFTTGTWLMILPTLFVGGTIVVLKAFGVAEFLQAVEQEQVTHAFLVPTLFGRLLEHGVTGGRCLASMTTWVSAGSSMSAQTKQQIDAGFPGVLIELYGNSEGFTTSCGPWDRAAAGAVETVGNPPYGWDVRIVDDTGCELPRGETGEIVGRSTFMFSYYHNRPELTSEAIWVAADGQSYIRSGDIGGFDEHGQLRVLDRKKDVIISGGTNIFSSDIELILGAHPAVKEVAVVGRAHPKWGETPVAVVVRREGCDDVGETELAAWANARLARYQKVSALIFRDSLPRNALGKVLKRELRDLLAST